MMLLEKEIAMRSVWQRYVVLSSEKMNQFPKNPPTNYTATQELELSTSQPTAAT